MIIKHNIAALNTQKQLNSKQNANNKSLEKLSSGMRINRAADDAAGLAISEKMKGQIRGLAQANRNIQDGASLAQTAEGGLSEIHEALQRMRELAVQAGNDTYSISERDEIKAEIEQLKEGINNIANHTEYNTIPLLNRTNSEEVTNNFTVIDGSETQLTLDSNYDTQPSWAGEKIAFVRGTDIYMMNNDGSNQSLLVSGASQPAIYQDGTKLAYVKDDGNLYFSSIDGSGEIQLTNTGDVVYDFTFGSSLSWNTEGSKLFFKTTNGIENVEINDLSSRNVVIPDISVSSPSLSPDGSKMIYESNSRIYMADADGTNASMLTENGTQPIFSPDGTKIAFSSFSSETGDDEIFMMNADGSEVTNLTGNMSTASSHTHNIYPNWSSDGRYLAFHSDNVDDPSTSGDIWMVEINSSPGGTNSFTLGKDIKLQVGPNSNQTFDIILTDARTPALGLDPLPIRSHAQVQEAIKAIDQAIGKVSSERSKYGAYQNALQHIGSNVSNYEENITASNSRIRDVDMAREVMNQTKQSILSQAAQTMLAQSQQIPQGVLQLLK